MTDETRETQEPKSKSNPDRPLVPPSTPFRTQPHPRDPSGRGRHEERERVSAEVIPARVGLESGGCRSGEMDN